jgi:hypothetical protein
VSVKETLYGPWDYRGAAKPFPYDDTVTYRLAGDWVSNRGQVEDWGCGTAWMRRFVEGGPYRGLDGAWSRFCDEVVDLRTYRSDTPCAVMRHVLEHNADWREIASNFSDSWHDRAALVLFIPPQVEDLDVGGPEWPVPDLAISGPDLFEILGRHGTRFDVEVIEYPPENTIQWSWEAAILMERGG